MFSRRWQVENVRFLSEFSGYYIVDELLVTGKSLIYHVSVPFYEDNIVSLHRAFKCDCSCFEALHLCYG